MIDKSQLKEIVRYHVVRLESAGAKSKFYVANKYVYEYDVEGEIESLPEILKNNKCFVKYTFREFLGCNVAPDGSTDEGMVRKNEK